MISLIRILCMVIIGLSMAEAKISISQWQFWAITVATIAYGMVSYVEGIIKGKKGN